MRSRPELRVSSSFPLSSNHLHIYALTIPSYNEVIYNFNAQFYKIYILLCEKGECVESSVQLISYTYKGPDARFMYPESAYRGWVILAVDQGTFEYGVEQESGRAAFGDLVFCPPQAPLRRRSEQPISFYSLVFDPGASVPPVGKVTLRDQTRLASNFAYIRQYRFHPSETQARILNHVIEDLLFMCETEKLGGRPVADAPIRQAAAYIREHCREPLLLQEVARRFGLSQSQFSRRFRAAEGLSPVQYLTGLRLDLAKSLLVESDLTIEAIADRCGFQNGFYLSRVFASHMNVSPSQYRKLHRV